MRILLAIDGSGHSEAAVAEIGRRHLPAGSEVRVISVIEPPYYPGSGFDGGANVDVYAAIEKDAQERAHTAVDNAVVTIQAAEGGRSLNVTKKIPSGPARGAILDEAETFGADLIIVGAHGHGKLERFLLGSVAHTVALHAKCSVEIVRSAAAHAPNSQ